MLRLLLLSFLALGLLFSKLSFRFTLIFVLLFLFGQNFSLFFFFFPHQLQLLLHLVALLTLLHLGKFLLCHFAIGVDSFAIFFDFVLGLCFATDVSGGRLRLASIAGTVVVNDLRLFVMFNIGVLWSVCLLLVFFH